MGGQRATLRLGLGWWLALLAASLGTLAAQGGGSPADPLLAPYGIASFSPLYRQSVNAFFTAWPAYQRGDYKAASVILDDFWKLHPAGGGEWGRAVGEGERVARTIGVEYGSPPCYYALRMLTECVAWRLRGTPARPAIRPLRFTVALIGHSHRIQPTTLAELRAGRGQMARNTLDERFREAPGPIIDDCFGLLFEYIRAFTDGRLRIEARILQYPDLDVPMQVVDSPGQPTAGLAPGGMEQIWSAVGEEAKASTDWWEILYPSHRPEQYAEFAHTDFSNGGGIGAAPDSGAPFQVGDDRVLVTKPPKYGGKAVTREERIAFFSAVMQHEFFHHLYKIYPEFRLEAPGHDWFDRSSWPRDFQGLIEPDYYAESLHKRVLPLGNPPVWAKLRYAVPAEVLRKLTPERLLGAYRRDREEHGWDDGWIAPDLSGGLHWTNRAGESWPLKLSADKRRLSNPQTGQVFRIAMRQDANGEYLPAVAGFWFNGELYTRLADGR